MPDFSSSKQEYLSSRSPDAKAALIQYLSEDRIQPEDGEGVLRLFKQSADAKLRLSCMLWLGCRNTWRDQIAREIGLREEQLAWMINRGMCRVFFPIVDYLGNCCLAQAYVYQFESSQLKSVCLMGKEIGTANQLAHLSGKSFLVGFNQDFEGDSWQLAVGAALIVDDTEALDQFAFTGIVLSNGDLGKADQCTPKQECCTQQGKRLIRNLRCWKELVFWLTTSNLPVPIIQFMGKPEALQGWFEKAELLIREHYPHFSLRALNDFWGLKPLDLAIYLSEELDFQPQKWQELLAGEVQNRFAEIERIVAPRQIIWFYAGLISSLQFGIGALFGFKRAIGIAQLDFSHQQYRLVFQLYGTNNARQLKNVSIAEADYEYLSLNLELGLNEAADKDRACENAENPQPQELGLILYMGSHNPIAAAKAYCKKHLGINNFLIMRAKNKQGVIEYSDNWLRIAQEINSGLNHMRNNYHWERIHLFQSAPTALCLALGIAIGHFVPVDIYHYQYNAAEPKYGCMYSLDKVFGYKDPDKGDTANPDIEEKHISAATSAARSAKPQVLA